MRKFSIFTILLFILILITACAPSVDQTALDPNGNTETVLPDPESSPSSENQAEPTGSEAEPTEETVNGEETGTEESPPRGAAQQFSTDFSIHAVPYDEILSGGPPKDGIPSIDDPKFIGIEAADEWLQDVEPIILVEIGESAKAYPLQILTWHEIVNDQVGEVPITVTFCPLCNTAIAFDRRVGGQVLDFGTTGRLRFSNLIMYDRQTETWWQQGTGEAIVGELTGAQLSFVPAPLISWESFKENYPDGVVLSRDTGYQRSYGQNPYPGYDDINRSPFLYEGPAIPGELPAVARILAVNLGGESVAYPYSVLSDVGVVNDFVGEEAIVVFWEPGTSSALDAANIANGEDVGSAIAFSRKLDDRILTFQVSGERFIDVETNSTWDPTGLAVSGPLAGEQLQKIVAVNYFWFSWAAFKPETRIYQP